MKKSLEVNNITKRYRKRWALDGLSFTVPEGCVMGLVGSNGAGKTTSLSAIAGLIRLQGGTINLLGQGPFTSRIHGGRVSLLPQDAQLPGHLRVDQFLSYLARLQGIAREKVPREIDKVLEEVNLTDRKHASLRSLSHGMRRRVTIAQAFMGTPDFIMLDEPLNGLDPREVANIRNVLQKKKPHQSLLISSHLLNEIEAGCDEVAFIEKGKCIRQDRMEVIVSHHEVVKVLLEENDPPLESIQDALVGDHVSFLAETRELVVTSGRGTISELNARLLKVLLDEGLSILEIRRGHGLEKEYLKD